MATFPGSAGLARINRVREIGFVLAKHGFHDVVDHLGLGDVFPRKGAQPRATSTSARIRRMAEELGPTFIKIGQVLSVRPDLVPAELIRELRNLQHGVAALPFSKLLPRFEAEAGEEWRETFVEINEEPLASASLAQVHEARLADGTRVAVKILKPGIRETVRADMGILMQVANALQGRLAALESYDLPGIVEELRVMLDREMDLGRELRSLRSARVNMRDNAGVRVPWVREELCTRGLLVMELVEGEHLGPVLTGQDGQELAEARRHELARIGLGATIKQILEDGFFHADPHPGNLLLCPDGRLAFLDWGMTGRLTSRVREQLVDLVWAVAERDAEDVAQVLCAIASPNRRRVDTALERDVLEVLDLTVGVELERISLGQLLMEMSGMLRRHGLRMPPDLAVMVKALVTAEGTARQLYPELDVIGEARPVLRRMSMKRKGPAAVLRDLGGAVASLARLHRILPDRLGRIASDLEDGRLSIRFRHEGLEGLRDTLESVTSRLALAVILGAIFLGSTLIMTTDMKPHIMGYPAFGVIGYLVSGLLGLWVVVTIIRGRRY